MIDSNEARSRHFRRNLASVAAWELIWGFGAACVAGPIVTALALELTGSKTAIGLMGLMQIAAVPALLLSAYLNRRLKHRRGVVIGLHCAQVLNWGLAGAVILIPGVLATTLFAVLVAVHGLIYFLSGLLTAPTYELLSTAFGRRYGTAGGIQLLVNRISGAAGGIVAEQILSQGGFPTNFGWVLLLGAACLTLSNVAVLGMVEAPSTATARVIGVGAYLAELTGTVRQHRDYIVFLAVVAIVGFMTVVQAFFTTFALEDLGMPVSFAGLFTTIMFASTGIGGLSGVLGDRWGHRRLLLGALAAHGVAALSVINAQVGGPGWFFAGLAASGLATAAASIATTNLMVDFAPAGERGAYAAVGRLATLGAGATLTPMAGLLIDLTGHLPLFGLAVAFVLVAVVVTRHFAEPRRVDARVH